MNSTYLLLFLSIFPTVILGVYVYKKDKVEKEPISLLIKLFILGIFSTLITLFISSSTNFIIPPLEDPTAANIVTLLIDAFIKVALIEEFSKCFILHISTWKNKEFNYIYDAIVYSVFISLGFATIENIFYVLDNDLSVAILRALLSVPGHAFFGVFMGYYYGLSRQAYLNKNVRLYQKNKTLSLMIPVLLHGTFDFCLMSGNILFLGLYLAFVIALYIQAFKKIKQLSNIEKSLFASDNHHPQLSSSTSINYCRYCGYLVDGNFCTNCGKSTHQN